MMMLRSPELGRIAQVSPRATYSGGVNEPDVALTMIGSGSK